MVVAVVLAFVASATGLRAEEDAPLPKKAPPSNTIQNEFFKVTLGGFSNGTEKHPHYGFYGKAGTFTITHIPSGKVFLQDFKTHYFENQIQDTLHTDDRLFVNGQFPWPHNEHAEKVSDPVLGEGWKLSCRGHLRDLKSWVAANTSIELYLGVPFVIIRPTLRGHLNSKVIIDVSKFSPASFALDLGKPAAQLKTLGTGGLLAADKNPGSHLFLTTADPASRNGVVVGWISQNVASGVVFSEIKDDKIVIRPELHFGHLFLHNNNHGKDSEGNRILSKPIHDKGGKTLFDPRQLDTARNAVTLDPLVIGYFDDARVGNELYADLIAKFNKIKLRPQSAVYCTWYADKNGQAGHARSTAELAPYIAANLKDHGMDTLQIDDMWQAGTRYQKGQNHSSGHPASHFDRVNPKGPYPQGIAPTAKAVNAAGLRLGLWWLPFGRHHFEPEYIDRQHWFVHRPNGAPYRTKSFGGTCLDLTHPDVIEHLRKLSRDMRQWGVTYYKMDGLWSGLATDTYYINDGYIDDHLGDHLPLHDLGKTNIEAYRQGLATIRQGAGDDVFFSGCNVAQNMRTLGASIGLVDAMRIGPDYNHDGKGVQTGPLRGSRLYFLNGKVWWNDPDPVKVRAKNGGVSLDHARLATSWVAHSGQFFLISDWLPNLDPDRLEILKRTMAPHRALSRPVDYFDNALPEVWLLSDANTRRDVLALYNWTKQSKTITADLARAGLDTTKTWHAFDFWANKPLPTVTTQIQSELPKESCQIVAIRPVVDHPVLVSTSRHITQGAIDVRNERWEETTQDGHVTGVLIGTSEVIANDPYELRIAGLGSEWKVEQVYTTSAIGPNADPDKPIPNWKTTPDEPGWMRFQIPAYAKTGTIQWQVIFTKQKDAASTTRDYTIQPGDTLNNIARAHNMHINDPKKLNPSINWTKLRVGDVIKVQK